MLRIEPRDTLAELPIDLKGSGRDDFIHFHLHFPKIAYRNSHQWALNVLAAAEATVYNIQYLRRLLRSGTLAGIKIGPIWLIEMESLEMYLQHGETASDRLPGQR